MAKVTIIWTKQAKESLRAIYDYYKIKSPRAANRVKTDLLKAPKMIAFSKQYQIDEINPKYRRIIVRDFKVLYKESKNNIVVIDIFNTNQSPSKMKNL